MKYVTTAYDMTFSFEIILLKDKRNNQKGPATKHRGPVRFCQLVLHDTL